MAKNHLVMMVLIGLAIVGGRQIGYRRWVERTMCRGCRSSLDMRLGEVPRQTYRDYRWEWRGIPVRCGVNVPGCAALARVQAGDRVTAVGRASVVEGERGLVWQIVSLRVTSARSTVPLLSYWEWVNRLGKVRSQINGHYRSYLGEPYAGLLSGIVLGTQNELSDDLYQGLVATGTMHVVAASGFNITLVANVLLSGLVLVFPRRRAVGGAIAGVVAYVILAGGSPAVVRAGVMGSLAFTAQALGKAYWAAWALAVSAALMLVCSPWLFTNVSFQLSVAATAGIMAGVPPIKGCLYGVSGWGRGMKKGQKWVEGTVNALATTIAATLATTPITLVTFGQVSVIAPLANILVLWVVPPLMVIGGGVAVGGLVVKEVGQWGAWLAWPLLAYFIRIVEGIGALPGVLVTLKGVTWAMGAGWWVLLAGWWSRRQPVVS